MNARFVPGFVAVFSLSLAMIAPPSDAGPWTAEKIIFTGTLDGSPKTLMLMNPDGTGIEQFACNLDELPARPYISPDGTKVAFDAIDGTGNRQIWVIDADGSNPVKLTALADGGNLPRVSGWMSNTEIMYTTNPGGVPFSGQIWKVDTTTSATTQLLTGASVGGRDLFQASIAPDRSTVAFDASGDIFVADIVSGALTNVRGLSVDGLHDRNVCFGQGGTVFWARGPFGSVQELVSKVIDTPDPPAVVRPSTGFNVELKGCSEDGGSLLFQNTGTLENYTLCLFTGLELQTTDIFGMFASADWNVMNASKAPGTVDGDANGDGTTDVNDISYVIFRLGNTCP